MQRGRLPEPDHVLDEWTSDTSLDASGVKKMMQTHRDVDEGTLAKMERAFRVGAFDEEHASLVRQAPQLAPSSEVDDPQLGVQSLAVKTSEVRENE